MNLIFLFVFLFSFVMAITANKIVLNCSANRMNNSKFYGKFFGTFKTHSSRFTFIDKSFRKQKVIYCFFFSFQIVIFGCQNIFSFYKFLCRLLPKKRYYFALSSLSILDENKIITFATSISCIRTVLAVCSWRICYSVFNKFQKMTQTLQTYWTFF